MGVQYNFSIFCKRSSETQWSVEIKSDRGEIPMLVVHPEATAQPFLNEMKVNEFLTTEPIVEAIEDQGTITRYLRQLNRRNSKESAGHNDAVIWNLSNRFPKLSIEQGVKVQISYFEHKGLRSSVYEIKSLGVFPKNRSNQSSARHFESSPANSNMRWRDNRSAPNQNVQISKEVSNTIANLVGTIDVLQQEFLTMQDTLQSHQILLKGMDEQIKRLEAENSHLKKIQNMQRQILQSISQALQIASTQPAPSSSGQSKSRGDLTELTPSSKQVDDDLDDDESPSLLQHIAQSQRRYAPSKELSSKSHKDHFKKK